MTTRSPDLDVVRTLHTLRSFRMGSIMRTGVVALMIAAMFLGTDPHEWPGQGALIGLYACAALAALFIAFYPGGFFKRPFIRGQRPQVVFTTIDLMAVAGFQLLSTGGYIPLLVMALLPIVVSLEVSWRRAGTVLSFAVVAFAIAILADTHLKQLDVPHMAFVIGIYAFLCVTALQAVYVSERHADAIAGHTELREELLALTMTASEDLQRRISESIHDGPLQDVLAARQGLVDLAARAPDDELDHALASLMDASTRLREATFELHPAVLNQIGVGAAVEQLAASTASRSGITITAKVDYPARTNVDTIVFGVTRELLSNVVRHSNATQVAVTLKEDDQMCCLDVVDDGVGMTNETAAERLAEGHIGLASHRARVEAAGGTFEVIAEPVGTHIRILLPLTGD